MPGHKRLMDQPQRHRIANNSAGPLIVTVEVLPSRYVLQPGDEMEIMVTMAAGQAGLSILYHPDHIQIHAGLEADPAVLINGHPATEDWDTPWPDGRA